MAASIGSRGPSRTAPARSTTASQARRTPSGSARDRPRALLTPELVLDQLEVLLGELVDVALEGQRPVLGRPLAHVVQPVRQLLGRRPLALVQDAVRLDPDAPGIVLLPPRRAPHVRVLLEHAGGQGAGG